MAHEIYYTSAPEGIKRGTSGFCTVAATDNIPKALWDRLESLSAYRHHFSANQSGSSERNPVAWAHWLLNVAGASYHVLSHVCDSGVDHTHRTNAFAHHVALDPAEMAPAGPAWMLQQNGIMESTWNGQVGSIPKRMALPRGDEGPAVCASWAALTGDAGWAGVLAEGALKSRPVCILFAPGQDVLPLIREAIRLLPVQNRWSVTFNTYFTSMPTSATCLWRCCLKGTPASDVAKRYAQAGLIVDLTNPATLGRPADSEYVQLARTGQLSAAARMARASSQAAAARATAKPAAAPARVFAPPVAPSKAPPMPAPPPEPIEEFSFLDETPVEPETPEVEMTAPADFLPPPQEDLPEPRVLSVPEKYRTTDWSSRRLVPSARETHDALREADAAKAKEARKHRRNLMGLYIGALGAIALGMLLVYLAYNNAAPPDLVPPSRPKPNIPEQTNNTDPINVSPIPPATQVVIPPTTIVEPVPVPATQVVVVPATIPVNPPPNNPPKVDAIKTIVAENMLERLSIGAGIGDKSQTLALPTSEFDKLKTVSTLKIVFPGSRAEYPARQEGLNGVISFKSGTVPGRPGPAVTLHWKDNSDNSASADVVTLLMHKQRAAIDVIWKNSTAQRKPELTSFVYWILQNSAVETEMPGNKTQRIEFRPIETKPISLNDASASIDLPATPPREAVVTPKSDLPKGWTATWFTDWEVKDTALRKPENASQVLKFRRNTSTAAVDGWFLLTFRPGFSRVESTFAKRQAADEADLSRYESELRSVTAEIVRIKKEFDRTDPPSEAKKVELEALVAAYKVAVAGYKELSELDIALDLPDGLRIATLRFRRDNR